MLRDIINSHISTLIFQLKNPNNEDEYYKYYALINSMYGDKKSYVILFVKKDRFITVPKTIKAKNVEWDAVRTMYININLGLSPQRWAPSVCNDPLFQIAERNEHLSRYTFGNENIQLIHNPLKKTVFQYPNTISLSGALETFSFIYKPSQNHS
ncbi:MAG TPA: hypothetical protein VLE02_02130 [Nitrosarchaeum sp.]|nr:hypothetical protein [Nitrosarchaeum sp.]